MPLISRIVLILFSACAAADAADKPAIRLTSLKDGRVAFEVIGLSNEILNSLAKPEWKEKPEQHPFVVYVDRKDGGKPVPMLGDYKVEDGLLRFEPRFGLTPGVRYIAELDPAKLPNYKGPLRVVLRAELAVAKPDSKPTTIVTQVYPTANTLPENQLKFYLHFSAPMRKGEAYDHIRLLDAHGKEINLAFLELGEELWDPAGKRLTLFIDPGRIKRGLKPREDLGPVFEKGKTYTLVIDARWEDAEGNPLKESFKKAIKIGNPNEKPIDVKAWKLEAPAANNDAALTVTFPTPLDHALLQRLPRVEDAAGKPIAGSTTVSKEETCWQFKPAHPWKAGSYSLVIPTHLEDLAGNQIGRSFEVDEFHPITKEAKLEEVKLAFEVK